ncbi:MAG TPA: AMP-dependent synthetase [Ruminiclostridium sp.]|jgi:long-chain acyl-CoA synthetase|nr:AMP-dependent synthetase [Ruminiclostridium sp.]
MSRGCEIIVKDGSRVVKGLGHYKPDPVYDCRELIKKSVERYGDKTAFKFKRDGKIIEKSYRVFDQEIDALGTALHALNLKGKKIAVLSENRYEWAVSYFSIINGTGIGVPLDKYLPQSEVENLIERAKVSAIFYSAQYHEIMVALSGKNTTIQHFFCMDEFPAPVDDPAFMTMAGLTRKGNELLEKGNTCFINAHINKDEMSILLFTSGTTKASKGVMLSHSNIACNITSLTALIEVQPNDVHLSLLPLHHTFENTIGLMFMLFKGITIAYSEGIRHIAQNLKEFKVTILVAVPAIFEALYRKVMEGIEKSGKKGLVTSMAKVSNALLKLGIDVRKKLFKSVMEKLGPDLRLFVSGAAPLDVGIINGIQSFGITFLQGYGLTETSPVISATTFFVNAPGTIGIPIKDVEVKIDRPDENGMGEILVRGGNVMLGYYENPEETREVMENGWFRTGDLGVADGNGILKITGRAKSMIVLNNGKKAFPEEFETLLNSLPGVKESFVWGYAAPDGGTEICAKIVVDEANMAELGLQTIEQMGEYLETHIRKINKSLPKYKIIRYFVLSREELVKTTTLKIKRPVEAEKIRRYLDRNDANMRKIHKILIDD